MLICGTLIMMRRFVSCDNAVAACPAPMLATSRSASICSSFRSRTSSMPPPVSLDEPAGVENQRRDPVAHDGRSAEHRQRPLRRVETLHDDLLLTQHPVYDDAASTLAHLEHHAPAARRGIPRPPQPTTP